MRLRTLIAGFLAVAFVHLPATGSRADLPRGEVVAITNAKVILEAGKVLDQAHVVVRKGVIEAVGAEIPIPFDALRIEGDGFVVHPGLIDGGSSTGYNADLRRPAGGEPTPLDIADTAYATSTEGNWRRMTPEFHVAQAIQYDLDDFEKWRLLGMTSRLVVPRGGLIAGQSALISLSGAPPREAIVRDSFAIHLAWEPEGNVYPASLMGMIAYTRQMLSDAQRFDAQTRAFLEGKGDGKSPPADPALEALVPMLAGKTRLAIDADSEDEIRRSLALAEEFNVRLLIVGGAEAWKLKDVLLAKDVAVLIRANVPDEPKIEKPAATKEDDAKPEKEEKSEEPKGRRFRSRTTSGEFDPDVPPRVRKERHRQWRERIDGITKLHQAGAKVGLSLQGLGSDTWPKRVELLTGAGGMSRDTLFALLTQGNASVLESDRQLGSIAPGKRAHLVVRKGMPLEKDSWVRMVVVDRQVFDYEPIDATEGNKKESKSDKEGMGKSVASAVKETGEADETKASAKKSSESKPADASPDTPIEIEFASEIESDRVPSFRTEGTVLLRGATVVTVSDRGDLASADVLVTGGKVARIGTDLQAPEGVRVIDARGLYLMPGMIDTHSHMAITGGVNEATLSVTPECRVRDVINSKDLTIYRALAGGVTTARLLHGSANCIGGQDAIIKLKYGLPADRLLLADASRGVKFALGENVKRTQGRFPNSRLGVEAVLVRAFSEAQAYQRTWDDYRRKSKTGSAGSPPRIDYRLDTLAQILRGERFIDCHCYRADEILMLLRVADQFGVKVRSLQHGLEGYKVAPEIAAHGCGLSTFSDWWAYKWEAYDATPLNTALLRRAGVNVCLKSDSDELVRHMAQEAAKLLRYDGRVTGGDGSPMSAGQAAIGPREALESVTLVPARLLGLEQRLGSIEVNKDADLALFQGHPLNTYARCVLTLVDGEVYFEEKGFWSSRAAGAASTSLPLSVPDPEARRRQVQWKASAENVFAITNATLVPVSSPAIAKGTIVIRDGVIADLGADVSIPREASVIDGQRLFVYPGFIDAGTKVGLAEVSSARETIDYQEQGVFQPDLRAATAIHPDSEVIPVTRASGVAAVVTMPASGIVAGQSALVNLAGWVPSEMVVVDPLALHVRLPSAPVTPPKAQPFSGRGRLASERERRLQEIRSLFRLAEHYHAAKMEARQRQQPTPLVNPRLEALAPYLSREKPVVFHADSARDIRNAIAFASELKVRPIIAGARDAWKVVDDLKNRNIPVIVGPVMTLVGAEYDPYDAPFRNLLRLHEANVRYCIQTDETSNSRNLPFEAAMAIAHGLPAEEGLKAITLYPAQILGVADKLGSLETGKIANLVITDGDPLQTATQVKGLFISGRPLEPTSKHTRLYERYLARLRPPVSPSAPTSNAAPPANSK